MNEVTETTPVYFSSIKLRNIKCFGEEQILDLKDQNGNLSQWTLILGNNGLGKTTLLKCIVWSTPVEETDLLRRAKAGLNEDDKRLTIKPALDGLEDDSQYEKMVRLGQNVIGEVSAELSVGTPFGEKPDDNSLLSFSEVIENRNGELHTVEPVLMAVNKFYAPNIYAYNASRHMELKNADASALNDPTYNLFSDSGELFDATEQLLSQDHAALQERGIGKETELLKQIKELLVKLLPGLKSTDDILISAKQKEVRLRTDDGEVPLNSLSLGYKTMVAWTVDLALKMLARNPRSDDPLREPAVVIIDEIDLHLHPTWQRIVQQTLTDTFPNTQFICTAHSPFMAQSSENENLCVLERKGKEVHIDNTPFIVKGWRIGQIITSDLFGVDSERSPEFEALIDERRLLLDKDVKTNGDSLRIKELDQLLAEMPMAEKHDDQALLDQLRKTAEFLKTEGKLK
ncbi:AAA family ATPase [Pedobacter aquatilis]|uniref:AAA family ATPase n=1 Tax=Pedobacter aquatilis TaxID=351343 RepID=UPI0025B57715|nr:AAA family ATPase [Pedobacter aquatilis]MDN3585671.1 AAA family ATPase [Pedobacter aquatilis]